MHKIPLNMLGFFQTYHFFVLTLFLGVPAWWLVFRHPQYRKQTGWIAVLVTPFALTERFFVPAYWNPVFLGPFFQWTGAGVEDLLFVVHLGWMTVYSPLVMFRRDWGERSIPWNRRVLARIVGLVLATFGSFGAGIRLGLNPLMAAALGMLFGITFMVCTTPQILRDMGRGLLAGGTAYFLVCLVYGAVYPEDFKTIWRTGGLSNQFALGVPLEEAVYGVLAGGLGGSFIPFLQGVPTRPRCLGNASESLGKETDALSPSADVPINRSSCLSNAEVKR